MNLSRVSCLENTHKTFQLNLVLVLVFVLKSKALYCCIQYAKVPYVLYYF